MNSQSTPQHTSNTPAKVNPSAQAVNPTWVPSNGSSSESQKEKEKEVSYFVLPLDVVIFLCVFIVILDSKVNK